MHATAHIYVGFPIFGEAYIGKPEITEMEFQKILKFIQSKIK